MLIVVNRPYFVTHTIPYSVFKFSTVPLVTESHNAWRCHELIVGFFSRRELRSPVFNSFSLMLSLWFGLKQNSRKQTKANKRLSNMAAWGGHWDFRFLRFWLFFRSVFRFLYSLRFADFPLFSIWFSVFAKVPAGFRIWYSMRFSVFLIWSIWVPVSLRSERQFTRLHWSRIAAKRKCYSEECVTNQLKYRRDHKVAYVKPYPPPR